MYKLITAIIRDNDAGPVTDALMAKNFRATRVASTGAFFREGNTTLIIGIEADQVDAVIDTIKAACGPPAADDSHRATIFVLNTVRHEQL
jgi:uncharacterized protein YaaQ